MSALICSAASSAIQPLASKRVAEHRVDRNLECIRQRIQVEQEVRRLDEDGHLWVTGRLSERIITGGVNVDPGEVERALRTHPTVQDVSVVGLPDPEWGERVVAAVEPVSGETPTPKELDEFVRERLSPAKRPRQWLFVELIPRNPNGKVNRRRLEELFVEGRPGE